MTFDDGPTPEITPWVLDLLKRYDAKATFFCVANKVEEHPDLYKKLLQNGHKTGNHSFSHKNGFKTKKTAYVKDIYKAEKRIESKLFRPPYGRMTFKQAQIIKNTGYKIIMWDVLSKDYNARISPEKCWEIVRKNTRNGSIIVFHDSQKAKKNLKKVLPKVLEHFSAQGFEFASL